MTFSQASLIQPNDTIWFKHDDAVIGAKVSSVSACRTVFDAVHYTGHRHSVYFRDLMSFQDLRAYDRARNAR